jgi:hypothetical protein
MNTRQIDYLNIGLIVISAILAFQYPLELFIVAFIILGPLHYFTEINWLDQKNYFVKGPKRLWLWIGLGSSVLVMLPKFYFAMTKTASGSFYEGMLAFDSWTNGFIFLSLVAAFGVVLVRRRWMWLLIMIPALVVMSMLRTNAVYISVIGVFLPTIIHVYLFTLIFMAFGAKKSKSAPGFIAVGLAILVPILISGVEFPSGTFEFSPVMKDTYVQSGFHKTAMHTAGFFGWNDGTSFFFYEQLELRLMTFLSFIYMYHYLNWFSKTSLIQWHKTLTLKRSLIIGSTWLILLALFYINYKWGLLVAIFFSMIHVILEFPLNVLSMKGLFARNDSQ